MLVYEAVGVYPALDYFSVDQTGTISLTRDLRSSERKDTVFTFVVRVYDSLRPNRSSQKQCTFNILRNQNSPQWSLPR